MIYISNVYILHDRFHWLNTVQVLIRGSGFIHRLTTVNCFFQIINFYMELIRERGSRAGNPFVHVFSTFFHLALLKGYEYVSNWTKNVDIFSYEFLVVPVNENNVHWRLVVSIKTTTSVWVDTNFKFLQNAMYAKRTETIV